MDGKKFSFGFSKTAKKPVLVPLKKPAENVQLIECLEGQSIKIKDFVEEVKSPLIIPVRESKKASVAYQLKQKQLEKNEGSDLVVTNTQLTNEVKPESELTLDELATRELINEARNRLTNTTTKTQLTQLPLPADSLPLDGEKEPTLDDYESVPINEYGLAMLRGMGWKEGMSIGKNTSSRAVLPAPELRPKGLGLGATKVVQSEMPKNKVMDKNGKELKIVKGAYAKVIAGAQKGNYCEVKGYDNEEGRVIVQIFPKGILSNINELLLTPVTKEEFSKGSKVLNNAKYDEYKKQSDIKLEDFRVKQEKLEKNSGRSSENHNDRRRIKYEEESNSDSSDSENHSSLGKVGKDSKDIHEDREGKYMSDKQNRKKVSDKSSYRDSSEERIREYSQNNAEEKTYQDKSSSENESKNRYRSKNKSKHRKSRKEESSRSTHRSRSVSSGEKNKSKNRKKYRDRSESEEKHRRKTSTKGKKNEKEYRENYKKKSKSKSRKSSSSSIESSSDN